MKLMLCLAIIVIITGCKGSPTSPASIGSMTGQMALVNSDCSYSSSFAGIAIELVGTAFKTTTDNKGFWTLSDVPAGIYDIRCSKSVFSTYEWTNVQFVGTGVLHIYKTDGQNPEYLTPTIQTTPRIDSIAVSIQPYFSAYDHFENDSQIRITVNFSLFDTNANQNGSIMLYGSKAPTIDPINPNTFFASGESYVWEKGIGLSIIEKANNISAGDTLYVTVAYEPPCHTDFFYVLVGNIQSSVSPSVGPISNTIRVIVP